MKSVETPTGRKFNAALNSLHRVWEQYDFDDDSDEFLRDSIFANGKVRTYRSLSARQRKWVRDLVDGTQTGRIKKKATTTIPNNGEGKKMEQPELPAATSRDRGDEAVFAEIKASGERWFIQKRGSDGSMARVHRSKFVELTLQKYLGKTRAPLTDKRVRNLLNASIAKVKADALAMRPVTPEVEEFATVTSGPVQTDKEPVKTSTTVFSPKFDTKEIAILRESLYLNPGLGRDDREQLVNKLTTLGT